MPEAEAGRSLEFEASLGAAVYAHPLPNAEMAALWPCLSVLWGLGIPMRTSCLHKCSYTLHRLLIPSVQGFVLVLRQVHCSPGLPGIRRRLPASAN